MHSDLALFLLMSTTNLFIVIIIGVIHVADVIVSAVVTIEGDLQAID